MKVWLKYLIGIALGAAAYFIIPFGSAQSLSVLDFIYELVIRFGRYTLIPTLFFSIAIAFFRLRDERLLLKTGLWTGGVIVVSSLLLTVIGLAAALFIQLPRIPITVEQVSSLPSIDVKELLLMLFPYNGFDALLNGAFLLPCFIFAGFAGAGAASDKVASKAAVSVFDSFSNVCYIVMSFFTEIFSIGLVAVSCKWTLEMVTIIKASVYLPLILMLAGLLVFIAGGVYPLILRLLCHDHHPYRVLFASISSFLVSFFTADTNLTLLTNMRHGSESLGIRRRVNAVTYPAFSIFARGGAALVGTVCFIVILRSYSSLGISAKDAVWIAATAFGFSFIQGALPVKGPFIVITIMCILYGRGFEAGYLLLRTAAPVICSFAAAFDAFTAMFGSYIVGVKTQMINHKELSKFI